MHLSNLQARDRDGGGREGEHARAKDKARNEQLDQCEGLAAIRGRLHGPSVAAACKCAISERSRD